MGKIIEIEAMFGIGEFLISKWVKFKIEVVFGIIGFLIRHGLSNLIQCLVRKEFLCF